MRLALIERFLINGNDAFDLLVPELKHKENCYTLPTEKLHKFDLVTVVYRNHNSQTRILEDDLGGIVGAFNESLKNVIENKRILPDTIPVGEVSLHFSVDTEWDCDSLDCSDLWLWSSTTSIQVWLYNKDHKIYLEISNTYRWLFLDPEPDENYISFEEYTKAYKPIAVYEISKEQAQKWVEQCNAVLENVDRSI